MALSAVSPPTERSEAVRLVDVASLEPGARESLGKLGVQEQSKAAHRLGAELIRKGGGAPGATQKLADQILNSISRSDRMIHDIGLTLVQGHHRTATAARSPWRAPRRGAPRSTSATRWILDRIRGTTGPLPPRADARV